MHFDRICLAVLVSLSTALFCGRAQAQSADSASEGKPHPAAVKAVDSSKQPFKPIRLVCGKSVPTSKSPLFVVDGKIITEQDIKSINPSDIDKIDILKSAAATALYGSRAASGAVLITMKHRVSKYIHQPEEKKGGLN